MKINKFAVTLFFSLTINEFVYADSSQKTNLLNQMSQSSSGGGLVNNNVVYSQPTNQSQSTSTNLGSSIISQQNQSTFLNNNSNTNNQNKTNVVKKKKRTTNVNKKTKLSTNEEKTKIDISFNNDVSKLPYLIAEYFPNLKPLPPLGRVSGYNISFDLTAVTIDEISGIVQSMTSGYVKIILNTNNNTIRLNYSSVSSNSLDPNKDNLSLSEKWRKGTSQPKPIMTDSGVLLFPYGNYQPIVTCKPQQVCDIQFEKGEVIIDAVMGDTERWIVSGLVSGKGDKKIRHIVLKPQYPDMSTNLIVTTDKFRTYNIKLVSTDKSYVSSVGFYYPQSNIDSPLNINNVLKNVTEDHPNNPNPENSGSDSTANGIVLNSKKSTTRGMLNSEDELPALNLDFRYKITGDDVVWKPVRVFNDGSKTFIEIPVKAMNYPSPAFNVYDPYSEKYELKNYRQKGNYFIVDSLFDNGELIYNVGRDQLKVKIKYMPKETDNKNWLY